MEFKCLLFFKAELVLNTHILRFIQQYNYDQTVTIAPFCKSEQKFNKASTLQFRTTLQMYSNDRKKIWHNLSVKLNKQQKKPTKSIENILAFYI